MTYIDNLSADQPDDVKAILDLAYQRSDMSAAAHDRVLAAFSPSFAGEIRRIAEDLRAAEEFRTDPAVEVLARYRISAVGFLDRVCDAHATELEQDAVEAAQLVASLMAQRPVRGVA
jgi:hypothetical protein